MSNHSKSKDFLMGAVIGGVLGTAAALITAPKTGKKLRQDLYDTYCDISDKTSDIADTVTKTSKCLANQVSSQTCDLTDKAKCLIQDVTDWINPREVEDHTTRDLIIGSLAGVVLGAVTGLFLAPKSGLLLRENLADAYEGLSERTQEMAEQMSRKGKNVAKKIGEKSTDWLGIAQAIISQLTDNARESGEKLVEKGKETASSKIKDIMDWASLGVQVLQQIKRR